MKPIQNWDGYFVDESGSIFSMKPNGAKGTKPPTEPRRLKLWKNGDGYFYVGSMKDGKQSQRKVARLVLETFVGPCPEGMEACHNNGVRSDDRLENLRWDTKKNNMADRKLHGTQFHANGEKHGQHKLNEMQVHIIRRYAKFGIPQRKIAKKFGVSDTTVSYIVHRKTWQHGSWL
jgi:hypothetical protein